MEDIKQAEKTDHSFVPALKKVLAAFNPRRIYEWGPGKSTRIMLAHPSVEIIRSVEHDKGYYEKFIAESDRSDPNWNKLVLFQKDLTDGYQRVLFKLGEPLYDLVFVDGRMRVQCMQQAKSMMSKNGFLILHDAERERYELGMQNYEYRYMTDHGWTAMLTNQKDVHERLGEVLGNG